MFDNFEYFGNFDGDRNDYDHNDGDNFGISGTQGGDLETSKFCHKYIYI